MGFIPQARRAALPRGKAFGAYRAKWRQSFEVLINQVAQHSEIKSFSANRRAVSAGTNH